jgi:multidrug efflux pump subunit AcrA (membrane-fusion protein)
LGSGCPEADRHSPLVPTAPSGQRLFLRILMPQSLQALCQMGGANFFTAPLFISGHWRYRCSVNEKFNLAVVDRSGKSATKRQVQLGRKNSDFIEVLGGLKPGERVITSSYSGLTDKDRLTFSSGE